MAFIVAAVAFVALGGTWVGVALVAMWKTTSDVTDYLVEPKGNWHGQYTLWYMWQNCHAFSMALAWLAASIVAVYKAWVSSGFQSYIFMEAYVL